MTWLRRAVRVVEHGFTNQYYIQKMEKEWQIRPTESGSVVFVIPFPFLDALLIGKTMFYKFYNNYNISCPNFEDLYGYLP